MDRAGFEPAASALRTSFAFTNKAINSPYLANEGISINNFTGKIDWVKYEEFVNKEYRPKSAYDRIRYAKTFAYCLLQNDCSDLLALTPDKREHIMNALSCLSKFLGIYENWSRMIKNYGLKWRIRDDNLIIKRFTKTQNPDELFAWIRQIKSQCVDLNDFMDFMLTTGLRFEESVESYNLIVKLSHEGKMEEYYNSEKELLEHYKFKLQFLRRTKKAFVSFVPKELIDRISTSNKSLAKQCIKSEKLEKNAKNKIYDDTPRNSRLTSFLRLWAALKLISCMAECQTSVFMRNYFNPAWITDLKEKTSRRRKTSWSKPKYDHYRRCFRVNY